MQDTVALPQELMDYILDFIHSDGATLRTCTLVARSWLPSSRRHLFSRVELPESRFSAFLAFAQTCAFGPQYVEDLILNGKQPQQDMSQRTATSPAFLRSVLPCLPRLKSLMLFMTLLREGEADHAPGDLATFPFSAPALKKLTMYYCGASESENFVHLARILGLFSSIDRLYLRFEGFGAKTDPPSVAGELADTPPAVLAALPTLRSLVIDDNAFRTSLYLTIFAPTASSGALRTLEVQSRHPWDLSALGGLLRAASGHLTRLSLDLTGLHEPEDVEIFVRQAGFAYCSALTSLSVKLDPGTFHRSPLSWPTLCALVGSIPVSAPLQTVHLHLGMRLLLRDDFFLPWNSMDEALARFDSLETVAFPVISPAAYTQEGKDMIMGAFPRVARKAKVVFPQGI